MLKKIAIGLVIILVSLTWFRVVRAGEMDNLSAADKAKLLSRLNSQTPVTTKERQYQTPEIFSADEEATDIDPVGSAEPTVERHGLAIMTSFDDLEPFGSELFKSSAGAAVPVDIPSASDYVLGPGDNLIVYLWGNVEREYNLTVDREGQVVIPKVGTLVAYGQSLESFTTLIQKRLQKIYSDFEVAVSLGKIRSIRVYVAGEVVNPGAFTVSSLTSMFNVVYQAGGPNHRGSMRAIRLMRNGAQVAEIDFYDFLLHGNNASDVRLQTGDVIFVPVTGARVAIRGEVNREAVYELKGQEKASDLLALAGNATPEAHLSRVMLERITGRREWEVLDLNLADSVAAAQVAMMDGDRITVSSIFQARTNMVAIYGMVRHPGYYERNDSTRISDLVGDGQLQPYDVYMSRANLFRRYPDRRTEVIPFDLQAIVDGESNCDMLLSDRDSIHIYSINEVERDKYVFIEGEISKPGRYPLYSGMKVEDLIFLAGSYNEGAMRHRAEIARLDSVGDVHLFDVYLDRPDSTRDKLLAENDHIYVRKIPQWEMDRSVTIEGEVLYPGEYTLSDRRETLYGLLNRAGGFTPNAFPKGIIFKRNGIQDNLDRMDVATVLERSTPIEEDSLGNRQRSEMFNFDMAAMNRIIIDMDKIVESDGVEGDIVLEPDDKIYIPSIPSGISVMGAVGANGTLKYVPGRSVKQYIKRAGDFTRQADKKATRLIRADGEVRSGGSALGMKVDLGDVIIVPSKVEKERNWFKTVSTALGATTGLLTSIYIVSKL